ncbi:phage tail protein I [Modicisalibacter sp. MOD 31.J]|uniref:phage tail protein I n=1 Tax=Modicisalibacter sp. MOD 31.J TaxID=2831897 RepID=UPI001CCA7CB1|nr:phage tail protein I [Modicisalibacter sp. MOD 31.J]MBZ9576728.1 phage tail protein I [Modicisalibacter sp. MOD 31.J]
MTDHLAPLLPPNATAQARRVAQATTSDVSPEILRTLYDPQRIPAELLPWLAWGENVPIWPDDERARRDIIARSRRLHGLIGTAAGLRAGARLTAGEVTRLITPPAKTFLGYWDAQSRRDWLAAMPQLRIYPRRARTVAQSLMLGHAHVGQPSEPALRSDAVFRATSRTTLWRPDGTETELTSREWRHTDATGNATLEVARAGRSVGLHCGQWLGGYPANFHAGQRLYRVDQQAYRYATASLSIRTTTASLEPLSTDVEIVGERAPRPRAQLTGLPVGGQHLARLDSETRYYRRSYLHDPDIQGRTTASPAHLGATRLGMPAFHVEARVRVPARRSTTLHLDGHIGSLMPADRGAGQHLTPTLDAMAWMRAEADKILIDTRHTSPLLARQTLVAGDYTAGQIIER